MARLPSEFARELPPPTKPERSLDFQFCRYVLPVREPIGDFVSAGYEFKVPDHYYKEALGRVQRLVRAVPFCSVTNTHARLAWRREVGVPDEPIWAYWYCAECLKNSGRGLLGLWSHP